MRDQAEVGEGGRAPNYLGPSLHTIPPAHRARGSLHLLLRRSAAGAAHAGVAAHPGELLQHDALVEGGGPLAVPRAAAAAAAQGRAARPAAPAAGRGAAGEAATAPQTAAALHWGWERLQVPEQVAARAVGHHDVHRALEAAILEGPRRPALEDREGTGHRVGGVVDGPLGVGVLVGDGAHSRGEDLGPGHALEALIDDDLALLVQQPGGLRQKGRVGALHVAGDVHVALQGVLS
mmetsp:Transcript_28162/g.75358  ORF Transcript_28162/g.75358 Transcript_28162/m.75358 type:complete len:235 (+) Transcript_28162:127-831(+)